MGDLPEQVSIDAFYAALRQHSAVASVIEDGEALTLKIKLNSGRIVRVRMTNIYCVGEADVREFLDSDPALDIVVTLSAWNLVSSDAATYGRERQKGVFTWKQFFGSINYRKFWLYEDIPAGFSARQVAMERTRRRKAWN